MICDARVIQLSVPSDHITSGKAATLLGIGRDIVNRWARRGRLHAVSRPGIDDAHAYLFNRPDLVRWRADRLPFGEAALLLGVPKGTLHRWIDARRIAPLTDMGGKQRWFSRADILRLRQDRLQGQLTAHSLTNSETPVHSP